MPPEEQPSNTVPLQQSVGYDSGTPPTATQPSQPVNPYSTPMTTPETSAPPADIPAGPAAVSSPSVVTPPASVTPLSASSSPISPVAVPTVANPPAPTATVADFGTSVGQSQMIKIGEKRRRIPKWLFALPVVGLLVIGGVVAAVQLTGTIPLEKHDEQLFSVLVPRGFKKDAGFMTVFAEKEGAEETHSGIVVMAEEYPQGVTAEQHAQLLDEIEKGLKERLNLNGLGKFSGEKMVDIKTERKRFKGHESLYFSASAEKDGRSIGKIKGMFLSTKKAYYMVLVAAHESDPKVVRSMDKIINSFEIK